MEQIITRGRSGVNTETMIREIRKIISKCTASERELYEVLLNEAEGWEMRLDELEED